MITLNTPEGTFLIDTGSLSDVPLDAKVTTPQGDVITLAEWATFTNGDCFRVMDEGVQLN